MGTPEFAVPSLDILLSNGCTVAAVVTAPDKPRGRGQVLSPTPVKELALARGLPVLQPPRLSEPAFAGALASHHPDIIVVVAFRILPPAVYSLARVGAFNLHASLLPRYRGAAPINRALMNGETETGVTTFLLREKVDTGTMLLQARVPIREYDDAGTLHDKLAEVGAEIVLHTVRLMEMGKISPHEQDDAAATPAPRILRQDCLISWNRPPDTIVNHIRGLAPSPAAFTFHAGRQIKVFRAKVTDTVVRCAPGEVAVFDRHLVVGAEGGSVSVLELQLEGRKRMTAEEFLRGYPLKSGEFLGTDAGDQLKNGKP